MLLYLFPLFKKRKKKNTLLLKKMSQSSEVPWPCIWGLSREGLTSRQEALFAKLSVHEFDSYLLCARP